jgi:hypothetical protein
MRHASAGLAQADLAPAARWPRPVMTNYGDADLTHARNIIDRRDGTTSSTALGEVTIVPDQPRNLRRECPRRPHLYRSATGYALVGYSFRLRLSHR